MLLDIKYVNKAKSDAPHPFEEGKQVMEDKILTEAIDVWNIKAMRPFHGNKYNVGAVTVVYLKPDNEKGKAKEYHVVGEYSELLAKVNELRSGAKKETRTA
jgi:hypothetical protein